MTTIKMTQSAYPAGGNIRAGNSVRALTTWYEAHAEDESGNDYLIVWELAYPDACNAEDTNDACDWEHPWAVLDESNNDVSDNVKIILA